MQLHSSCVVGAVPLVSSQTSSWPWQALQHQLHFAGASGLEAPPQAGSELGALRHLVLQELLDLSGDDSYTRASDGDEGLSHDQLLPVLPLGGEGVGPDFDLCRLTHQVPTGRFRPPKT